MFEGGADDFKDLLNLHYPLPYYHWMGSSHENWWVKSFKSLYIVGVDYSLALIIVVIVIIVVVLVIIIVAIVIVVVVVTVVVVIIVVVVVSHRLAYHRSQTLYGSKKFVKVVLTKTIKSWRFPWSHCSFLYPQNFKFRKEFQNILSSTSLFVA